MVRRNARHTRSCPSAAAEATLSSLRSTARPASIDPWYRRRDRRPRSHAVRLPAQRLDQLVRGATTPENPEGAVHGMLREDPPDDKTAMGLLERECVTRPDPETLAQLLWDRDLTLPRDLRG